MLGGINKEKQLQLWEKRNLDERRAVNSLIRITNLAAGADAAYIYELLDRNQLILSGQILGEVPLDEKIVASAVLEMNAALPEMLRAERRLTRLAINDFNSLSSYPDIVFNDYYRSVSDKITSDNLRISNRTTTDRTRALVNLERSYIGQEVPDEVRVLNRNKYFKDRINRNDTFAWTTSTQVSGRVDNELYQSEFVAKKEWRSIGDSRVRPTHQQADGQIVDKDKNFLVGGRELAYPSQYRCRCKIYPIYKETDQVIDEYLQVHGVS